MKKVLSLLLMAILYANPTIAQTDTLKHEIGFSTQIILNSIFNSSGTPAEFMYKKKLANNKWIRWGVDANLSLNKNNRSGTDQYDNSFHETSGASVAPSIGLEKRVFLSNKWNFLYGSDLTASYSFSEYKHSFSNNQIPEQDFYSEEQNTDRYGVNLQPFLGLTFSPIKRFYISTEASLFLGSFFDKRKIKKYHNDALETESTIENWQHLFQLRPASAIFVYYRF